jgi:hypothetical protein
MGIDLVRSEVSRDALRKYSVPLAHADLVDLARDVIPAPVTK